MNESKNSSPTPARAGERRSGLAGGWREAAGGKRLAGSGWREAAGGQDRENMPHLRSLWPKSERCAGSSILELVMVLALLLVVLGGALTLVFHSQIGFAQQMEQFAIEQSGRHIVERLTNEFQQASPASIQPLVMQNSKYATYQRVVGYSGGAVQLGPQITMIFEPAEGESQNGSDDNGDGRVDEGYVSYREANQAPVRLVGDVVGLRFTSTATGISFSVDIGRVDRDGRLMQRTFTQVATFRN